MQLYSQHDPAYDRKKLGKSNLTVHGYGCFLVSLANLYQRSPVELLGIPNAINDDGLLIASVIAKYCGGEYSGQFQAGAGWQIAQTDHFAPQGFPTHFFAVNLQSKQQIDPLKFPAVVEPLTYKIVNVRVFTNTDLPAGSFQPPPSGPYPDVAVDRWSVEPIRWAKEKGIMTGYENGLFEPLKPVSREELAVVAKRLYDSLKV